MPTPRDSITSYYEIAKYDAASSASKSANWVENSRSIASISSVVQLPLRIQTTFGGCPYRKLS
jgi:hypothetical protein